MSLTSVVRVRIIMDLLKDGDVGTEANYDSSLIDYIDAPTALKHANAFVLAYGPIPNVEGDPTNEQKATFYLNCLRKHHAEVTKSVRGPAAGDAARIAEIDVVTAEVESELGTDEEIATPE